jgi:hypothetical protein
VLSHPHHEYLVLQAQRELRVVISQQRSFPQTGQIVTGTLLEPVYAYDRIVLPQGMISIRIVELKSPPAQALTPRRRRRRSQSHHQATVIFDGATAADGRRRVAATVARIGPLVRHRAPIRRRQ